MMEQEKIKAARLWIQNGEAECVLIVKDGSFIQKQGRGLMPLLTMYNDHKEAMCDAILVDKVVGRAAASIAICGKVKYVYGELMSEEAVEFLKENGIATGSTTLVHGILRRDKSGPCPMEQSIKEINNAELALKILREKIILQKKTVSM